MTSFHRQMALTLAAGVLLVACGGADLSLELDSTTEALLPVNDYWVSPSGADTTGRGTSSLPWKTLQYAANNAVMSATCNALIHVGAGTYQEHLLIPTTKAGIIFENVAGDAVVLSPPVTPTQTSLIKISGISGSMDKVTTFRRSSGGGSFTLSWQSTAPTSSNNTYQLVNVYNASYVEVAGLTLQNGLGFGVQIGGTAAVPNHVTVRDTLIQGNAMNGIRENTGDSNIFRNNDILNNGNDGQPFNGDGILMQGTNSLVELNRIRFNGNDTIYEHGIYVGSSATGFTIQNNDLEGNSASGVKATGSGRVLNNHVFGKTKIGIVLSDNSGAGIEVAGNTVDGDYLYGMWITQGTTAAIGNIHDNTFGGLAPTWGWGGTYPDQSPPTFIFFAYANRIDLTANKFTGAGKRYSYFMGPNTAFSSLASSNNNQFNLGKFRDSGVDRTTFSAWKTAHPTMDPNSTCSGTSC